MTSKRGGGPYRRNNRVYVPPTTDKPGLFSNWLSAILHLLLVALTVLMCYSLMLGGYSVISALFNLNGFK